MYVDTERLTQLSRDYQTILDTLDPSELNSNIEKRLMDPINEELHKSFGKYVFLASSLVMVGGMERIDDMHSRAITNPPNLVGVEPRLEFITYPHSPLGKIGLTPSLVFTTHDPEYSDGLNFGISQLFPYVALPLIEPHFVEAIAVY